MHWSVFDTDAKLPAKGEKKFKKNGLFLDTIPSNLESQVCEHCVIVIDDMEDLLNTKEMAAMTLRFAKVAHLQAHITTHNAPQ